MNICALILATTITGQTVEVPDHQVLVEEMLAHIYVSQGPEVMEKAREHFKSQSPSQIRVIYRIFKDKKAQYEQQVEARQKAQQQMVLNQAILNKQKAEAYRDHLKREFDITIQQKRAELEVLRSANRFRFYGGGYRYYPRNVYVHRGRDPYVRAYMNRVNRYKAWRGQ